MKEQKPAQSAPYLLQLLIDKKITTKQLTPHMKRVLVRHLIEDRRTTSQEIAIIIGLTPSTVRRWIQRIRAQNQWMLDEIDERKLAIDMIQVAETAVARLFKRGKERDAYWVLSDLVDRLQSLGFISRKPVQFEGQVNLIDLLNHAHKRRIEESEREFSDYSSRQSDGNGGNGKRLELGLGGSDTPGQAPV